MKLKKLQLVVFVLLPLVVFSCKTWQPLSEQKPTQEEVAQQNQAILDQAAAQDQQALEQQQPASVAQEQQAQPAVENETRFVFVQSPESTQAPQDVVKFDTSKVEVIGKVYFAFDSSEINDVAGRNLESQLAWLQTNEAVKVKIEGHCDARGSKAYNYKLGKRRALAVKNYLVQNGIASARIKSVTYGEDRPEVKGSGETIWSQNRRAVTLTRIK